MTGYKLWIWKTCFVISLLWAACFTLAFLAELTGYAGKPQVGYLLGGYIPTLFLILVKNGLGKPTVPPAAG
jgi:hypothetical protein